MDLHQGIQYEQRLRFLRAAIQRAMSRIPDQYSQNHVTCDHAYCILRRALAEESLVESGEQHANESG